MFDFYDPIFGWPPVQSTGDKRLLENTYIPMCESKEEEKMDVSKMTKEQALKAIDDLKKYVEKCEEKEKEIPRMHRGALPKSQPTIVCPWTKSEDMPIWWKDITEWMTFNEDDTFLKGRCFKGGHLHVYD